MADVRKKLSIPEEPVELRAETRAILEESPEEGTRVINDARFVADLLWDDWADTLEAGGMDYDRFLEISRGYADELRLWVFGERIWDHCVSGLAGRALRRLPSSTDKERVLSEVSR